MFPLFGCTFPLFDPMFLLFSISGCSEPRWFEMCNRWQCASSLWGSSPRPPNFMMRWAWFYEHIINVQFPPTSWHGFIRKWKFLPTTCLKTVVYSLVSFSGSPGLNPETSTGGSVLLLRGVLHQRHVDSWCLPPVLTQPVASTPRLKTLPALRSRHPATHIADYKGIYWITRRLSNRWQCASSSWGSSPQPPNCMMRQA